MKWGNIREEFSEFGWKKITSHEVDPRTSHGHEFQGVKELGRILGDSEKPDIPTDYYLITDDALDQPVVNEVISSTSSWWCRTRERPNKRGQRKTTREWRLYYPSDVDAIQRFCRKNDLAIFGLRKSGRLAVFLIKSGTSAEAAFQNLLGIGLSQDRASRGTFLLTAREGDIGVSAAEFIEQLALSMEQLGVEAPPPFPTPSISATGDDQVLRIAEIMLGRWPQKLGTCADVADIVLKETVLSVKEISNNPDFALVRWLEAAEASYRIWEDAYLSKFIGPLRVDSRISNEDLADRISTEWMSLRQSRVRRAGTMLELFLVRIFQSSKLHFDWGKKIEGGKLPDFIFPSARQYGNAAFPKKNLRILGAKTSLKDRWRQILAEGNRVKRKHGVTRDISVTRRMLDQMMASSFFVVIPEQLRVQYVDPAPNLINLSEFIGEVRSIQGKKRLSR